MIEMVNSIFNKIMPNNILQGLDENVSNIVNRTIDRRMTDLNNIVARIAAAAKNK